MITQLELVRRWLGQAEPVDWEAVITAELPRVFNYFRYQGLDDDTAEDLAAATFEKAWRARRSYRSDKAGVATWLMTIARRAGIDYFRSSQPETDLETLEDMHPAFAVRSGPEETLQRREEIERLRCLLAALPERERELVALKYGAEMTNRAIAKLTGLSESNVGTILHRVVTSLRVQMELDR
jgi:RNA polymerase sigma-70 factor (ECF subfamily)